MRFLHHNLLIWFGAVVWSPTRDLLRKASHSARVSVVERCTVEFSCISLAPQQRRRNRGLPTYRPQARTE